MGEADQVTYQQIVSGSVWMIGMRWGIRGVGLMSTAILARLLAPEDFGLVAMGTIVIALIQTFSELGTVRLLIRMKNPDRADYDTAWTIILLQGIVLACLLYLAAPLAARYFSESRVTAVIRWLALSSVIIGLGNIGVINLQKNLQFRKDFLYGLCCKLSTVLSTVPLAFLLRSYWALVVGTIVSEIVNVPLSYLFHEYRPRFSLARWRGFVRFSLWITPSNVVNYFVQRLDSLIVGAVGAAAQLGLYHFASEVSKMATNEVIVPMGRALYPSYAKMTHDGDRLANAFLTVLSVVAIFCFALGPGLAVVADDFVHVLLGEKWVSSIPLVRFLALSGALGSIAFVLRDQIFVVTGNERLSFILYVLQLVIAAPCLIWVGLTRNITNLAATTTALAAVFVLIAAVNVRRAVPISFLRVLATFGRPIAAACVMVTVVRFLHIDSLELRALRLLIDVVVGAIVYIVTLLFLWRLGGRPEGPEKAFADFTKRLLAT